MDILGSYVGVGLPDRLHDLGPRGPEIDQDRTVRRPFDNLPRQNEVSHISLVGTGHLERLIEEVKHGHRAGRTALGKTRCVFKGVDCRAPHGDSGGLEIKPELRPLIAGIIDQPVDTAVEKAGHLRPGIDSSEAEQWIGAHFGCLSRLRHQTLAEGDHDGVVLRETARQVPECLREGVGRDRISILFDAIDARLVETLSLAPAAEEPGAESGDRRRHDECPLQRASDKRNALGDGISV